MDKDVEESKQKIILLVEDDQLLLQMYSQRLVSEGFGVLTASDGEEALKIYKEKDLDLVITDIMLPRMSGTEFLEKIRSTEKVKNLPVIVWTNLAIEQEKKQAMALGANEYLVKESVTLNEFVELVKKYVGQNLTP